MASCFKTNISKDNYAFINQHEEAFFQHKNDMDCVAKHPCRLMEKIVRQDKKNAEKFVRQMKRIVGPAWFQELSQSQIIAADLIFEALKDDVEDIQYKQCRNILKSIGLSPLPKKTDIFSAIHFSRGNDLAFLWFFYDINCDACANAKERKNYSLSERLILSCICHLDMMTTLRELNRILPNPEVKVVSRPKPRAQKLKIVYDSPYDEPVPKPKIQPERFFPPPQRIHPTFEIYRKYKDPNFIIKNEANRWYTEDNLIPTEQQRIARGVICDEIDRVVEGKFDREKVLNGLCEKHRFESTKFNQMMKKLLNGELSQREIDDNLKDYGPFERGIIYGVQIELEKSEKEFQDVTEKLQNQVTVKTLLRKVVENAADLKYIHMCKKCENCAKSKEVFREPVEINDKPNSEESSTEFLQSDDENLIKFFRRPSSSSPFEFDYEKVFATNFLRDCGVVKNSINAALELNKHLTEDNAITACLRDMWRLEMKQWNEKRQAEMEAKEKIVADCDKIGKNKRKFFGLLFKGIEVLRKNPKFVLAALPEVHRLPFLKEWILQRFGIRYDAKYNEERWKINKIQRDRMEQRIGIVPKIEITTLANLGVKNYSVSLDDAIKIKVKRDKWIKSYYKQLSQGTIETSRFYWNTLEPYLCKTERMRQIFYAYMPSREQDLDKIVMNEEFS